MYKLGIDLGGTNIVAGVVDENYRIISTAKRKTNCPRSAEEIVNDMAAAAMEAVEKSGISIKEIDAAGVGTPGSVDAQNGIVCYANNLGFKNVEVAKMLKRKTGLSFYIENDANAATYGEFIAGVGKGTKNFIMITLGTGVGGGIIIDSRIYSGHNYAGGELGHSVIVVDGEMCTCGRQGCWEAYASVTALIRQTKQAMIKYPNTIMWEMCGDNINAVDGRTSFDAMRKGDEAGKWVVDKYINYIAVGIANNINVFQPEIICIGGGISKEGDTLIEPIKKIVKGENYGRNLTVNADIKVAQLGGDAGIIGAAYICNLYK